MKPRNSTRALCSLVVCVVACAPAATRATPCDSLARLDRPGTTITSARLVAAGAFRPAGNGRRSSPEIFNAFDRLAAFCRLEATIPRSSDSRIKIEVWLPVSGWNGKYLGVGNGGYAGSIAYARLGEAVSSGYASASTDTGHEGDSRDATWANGHPDRRADFDHRAIHEMTLLAKAAIHAFYNQATRHSYFSSCSNGGRQGLMEAELYPTDYDGVMSGAPAFRWGFDTFLTGQLDAFRDRGGKLVIYHGSRDAPAGTIDYYERLVRRLGKKSVDDFMRVYIVPGMGHCGSGNVPNDFGQWVRPNADAQHSMLSALEAWVEAGAAPEGIIATQWRVDGDATSGAVRTRPLCPYPGQARWSATGSRDSASSYSCQ